MSFRASSTSDVRRRIAGSGVLPAVGACVVLVLLLTLAREPLYRGTAAFGTALPGPLGALFEVVGELGILVLLGAAAFLAWRARSRGLEHVALAVAAGVTTVGAYVLSEVVKSVVGEERPCRTLAVHPLAACPPPGDYSWPSNHAVIAASLATAVVVLAPTWWRFAAPVALAVGVSRVVTGAHYWHDVVTGVAVGVLVVWFATWALVPWLHARLEAWVDGSAPDVVRRVVGEPVGERSEV
ncbi:phosphatase PAP2 family protein [Intrasporangium sp. YIM S08009]|uniref:phosphatase PAP2 family protein n=1 Tax=Intrasporangium zincisolvens TaxID=3080018 RepID=UPI002B0596F5|nr:phosphatase PAP2 family protein [Intrasporangium sp. YIM S08009]